MLKIRSAIHCWPSSPCCKVAYIINVFVSMATFATQHVDIKIAVQVVFHPQLSR